MISFNMTTFTQAFGINPVDWYWALMRRSDEYPPLGITKVAVPFPSFWDALEELRKHWGIGQEELDRGVVNCGKPHERDGVLVQRKVELERCHDHQGGFEV